MKKMFVMMVSAATLALTSCEVKETKYVLNSDETSLNWTGKYVADGHTHMGTVKITEGSIVYKGEEFVSGEFKIDMKSITATDVDGEMKTNLEGHLNSLDYFNTSEFSNATVTIEKITADKIVAKINVLGKTVNADMPVKITKSEEGFSAKGKFELDFSATQMPGFKAAPKDPENAHPDTKIAFELNLVLKK
jgi:polyisoprenoid-binding protein YceI